MSTKLSEVLGLIAVCLTCFQFCRSLKVNLLEGIPRQDLLDKANSDFRISKIGEGPRVNSTFRSSEIGEDLPARKFVLQGVTASLDAVVVLEERMARIKFSAMNVYPEMICEVFEYKGSNLLKFDYTYETNYLDTVPMKHGECTADILMPVSVQEMIFQVKTSAVEEPNNPHWNVLVNFDSSIEGDHMFPGSFLEQFVDMQVVRFAKMSCAPYGTRGKIEQCRCLHNNITFGKLTPPVFLPIGHRGQETTCPYATWLSDSSDEAVLWVAVEIGQRCLFSCQSNLTYGNPPVTVTRNISYLVTGYFSYVEVVSFIYNQIVYGFLFIVLMAIVIFILSMMSCRFHLSRSMGLRNDEIEKLIKARLRRKSTAPKKRTRKLQDFKKVAERRRPQSPESRRNSESEISKRSAMGPSWLRGKDRLIKKKLRWKTVEGTSVDNGEHTPHVDGRRVSMIVKRGSSVDVNPATRSKSPRKKSIPVFDEESISFDFARKQTVILFD